MKTCGMMGEVVGKAASICTLQSCTPRDVYERYLDELKELLILPGKARRETVSSEITVPSDALPLAGKFGPPTGLPVSNLKGLVIDDLAARKEGKWTNGTGLKGYIENGYLYASANSNSKITYSFNAPATGSFDIRINALAHENRASNAKVMVSTKSDSSTHTVNLRAKAPLENNFVRVGKFDLKKDEPVSVIISTEGANGTLHADAVQVLAVE
jgi:hypothetical protein